MAHGHAGPSEPLLSLSLPSLRRHRRGLSLKLPYLSGNQTPGEEHSCLPSFPGNSTNQRLKLKSQEFGHHTARGVQVNFIPNHREGSVFRESHSRPSASWPTLCPEDHLLPLKIATCASPQKEGTGASGPCCLLVITPYFPVLCMLNEFYAFFSS